VLSRGNRITSTRTFARAVRKGRRAGARTLVVHLSSTSEVGAPLVGFVVSKAVGNAVTRNLVKRRLRHLTREWIDSLPGSAVLVVRAMPAAGAASYRDLAVDLEHALGRLGVRGVGESR
jgi:ribonuclease P protein component